MNSSLLFFILYFLGWSAAYTINYTSYSDNTCSEVNPAKTGQIFANKCALEYRTSRQSGKIVFINEDYLTSCDYSDDSCNVLSVCENYTNSICYGSSSTSFSNKYSWVSDGNGGFAIMYTSYNDSTCTTVNTDMTGQIFADKCAPEYMVVPQSGMIIFINDEVLTSCDYSDTQCTQVVTCKNYTNANCYASRVAPFSNKYSWDPASSGSGSTSGSESGNSGSDSGSTSGSSGSEASSDDSATSGSDSGNDGSSSTSTGSDSGNEASTSSDPSASTSASTGSESGNTGSDSDSGSDSGNAGSTSGSESSNSGSDSGNAGSTSGSESGNSGSDSGNAGSTSGSESNSDGSATTDSSFSTTSIVSPSSTTSSPSSSSSSSSGASENSNEPVVGDTSDEAPSTSDAIALFSSFGLVIFVTLASLF